MFSHLTNTTADTTLYEEPEDLYDSRILGYNVPIQGPVFNLPSFNRESELNSYESQLDTDQSELDTLSDLVPYLIPSNEPEIRSPEPFPWSRLTFSIPRLSPDIRTPEFWNHDQEPRRLHNNSYIDFFEEKKSNIIINVKYPDENIIEPELQIYKSY